MTAIKPRTARVVIYQGDDLARLSDLDDAVTKAELALHQAERAAKNAEGRPRLMHEPIAGDAEVAAALVALADAKAARDEFATEAETRGVAVVMNAVPRKQWRSLMNEHGPREGVKEDEPFSVNMETLPDVLLPMSIDREQSTIEGDTGDFLESLSDYDYYDRLFLQSFALNRGSAMADPTQRLGSVPSPTLSATSS